MKTVTANANNTAHNPATYGFGVQWYAPFEPSTATMMQNCINLSIGVLYAV